MSRLHNAIKKIKHASLLLIGDEQYKHNYNVYFEIKPSGSVEEAWKEVGKYMLEAIDQYERRITEFDERQKNYSGSKTR